MVNRVSQLANFYKGESKMIDLSMIDLVPDSKQLAEIFSQAIAPTFFLGAIAAFIGRLEQRLWGVVQRLQTIRAIAEDDLERAHLKADVERLRCRARFLTSGIRAALHGGLCATALLGDLFISALFKFKHAYGAPGLFVIATLFLGFALFRLAQESRINFTEADEYL